MKRIALALFALSLAACHDVRREPGSPTAASATPPAAEGVYDNHAQVWQAHESAPGAVQPPHVVVTIDATSQPDWALWRIHLDATPPVDAVVVPWSESRFQYTVKDVALPASGTVTITGRQYEVPEGSWAVLDHGRGRWPYRVTWNWGAGLSGTC